MPIHLSTYSRREWLTVLGGGVLTLSIEPACGESARGDAEQQDDLIYLLNDTHIGEKHPTDSPVPSHLRQVVKEVTSRKTRPAALLINGDLALKDGQPGDYRHFARLLAPLREAKINVHLTLGNHDHRDVFYEVLKSEKQNQPPVTARHLSVVKTRYVNLILLDSLIKTMVTQGRIGDLQLKWLAQTLDQLGDKPAVIVSHHNPRLGGDPLHFPGGLIDSESLWSVLKSRRQVKAYFHGHIHDRGFAEHQGIHIINTPATSYVADPKKSTTGWTTARFDSKGVQLTTHTNQAEHPWNGLRKRIEWRT